MGVLDFLAGVTLAVIGIVGLIAFAQRKIESNAPRIVTLYIVSTLAFAGLRLIFGALRHAG